MMELPASNIVTCVKSLAAHINYLEFFTEKQRSQLTSFRKLGVYWTPWYGHVALQSPA